MDSELDTGLYELALTYTPGGSRGPFTAFAGARIVDLSLELTFTAAAFPDPIRRTSNKSFTDFMVGGRYVHSFNDHWILSVPRGHRSGRHGVELERARGDRLAIRR